MKHTLEGCKPVCPGITKTYLTEKNETNVCAHTTQPTQSEDATDYVKELQEMFDDCEAHSEYAIACEVIKLFNISFLEIPQSRKQCPSYFNGRYWETLTEVKLQDLIYQYISTDDKDVISNIQKKISDISNYIFYECYRDICEIGHRFSPKDYKKVENCIVFTNCVYDTKKQKTYDFSSSLPYTFGLNIPYINNKENTPAYDKIRSRATGNDKEAMKLFNYMLAYLCIPNRSGKCLFYLADARDSGKSLLISVFSSIFPDNLVATLSPEHLNNRFELACAADKVLLACPEMKIGMLSSQTITELKRLTGEEKIRIEKKSANATTVTNRVKIVLASNGALNMGPFFDEALLRRVIAVPFLHTTPAEKLDYSLKAKLSAEMPYIISNAARKLHKIMDDKGGILIPECELSRKMKASWTQSSDCIEQFISLYLRRNNNTNSFIWKRDIYKVYQSFVSQSQTDSKAFVASEKTLNKKIETAFPGLQSSRRRIKSREKEGKAAYVGIEWAEDVSVPKKYKAGCSYECFCDDEILIDL